MDPGEPLKIHEILDSPINCDGYCPRVKELVGRLAEVRTRTTIALDMGVVSVKNAIETDEDSNEGVCLKDIIETVADSSKNEDEIMRAIIDLKAGCRGPTVCEGSSSTIVVVCNSPQIAKGKSTETCTVYREKP